MKYTKKLANILSEFGEEGTAEKLFLFPSALQISANLRGRLRDFSVSIWNKLCVLHDNLMRKNMCMKNFLLYVWVCVCVGGGGGGGLIKIFAIMKESECIYIDC